MTDTRYARLFDAAFESVSEANASRRKEKARAAAQRALPLIGAPQVALASLERDLRTDLGARGAARIVELVREISVGEIRVPRLVGKPKVAVITAEETVAEAEQIWTMLTSAGCDSWLYSRSVLVGQRIRASAERAITEADYVVALVSRAALASSFVTYELDLVHWSEMRERRERLLPVVIDDLPFNELPPFLGTVHAISWVSLGPSGVSRAIALRIQADAKLRATRGGRGG